MTFTAIEQIPLSEIELRHKNLNTHLQKLNPHVGGILIFCRPSIYYFTGTFANGLLWLPLDGEPVLFVRKGIERCKLESPLKHIYSFTSYSDVPKLCADIGQPLSMNLAAETKALSWSLANLLQSKFSGYDFSAGDMALAKTKAVKTAWEICKLKIAGKKQVEALCEKLPQLLECTMTERQIAHLIWNVYFELEHDGMLQMANYNEKIFLGHIYTESKPLHTSQSAVTMDCIGVHAAIPFMGYAGKVWDKNTFLYADTAFAYQGYHTAMKSIYWNGEQNKKFNEFKSAHLYCQEFLNRVCEFAVIGETFAQVFAKVKNNFNNTKYILKENMGMGLGLSLNDYPQISIFSDIVLEENMVFTLSPTVEIHKNCEIGIKETFVATKQGPCAITDENPAIHII